MNDFKSSDHVNYGDILDFHPGLKLYHITPLNIPENYDDYPFLEDLAKDVRYTYDMSNQMYFGLTEHFTKYYDYWDKMRNDWNCAHLMFETKNSLKLVYINKHGDYGGSLVEGIDGWIAYDDPFDNFREVLIFQPWEHLIFHSEFIHRKPKKLKDGYHMEHFDQHNLEGSFIGNLKPFVKPTSYRC